MRLHNARYYLKIAVPVLLIAAYVPPLLSEEDSAVTGIITLTLNNNVTKWYTLSGTDNEGYYNTASWQYYNDPVTGTDYIMVDLYAFPDEQTEYDGPFLEITLLLEDSDTASFSDAIIQNIIFSPSGLLEDYYIHDEQTSVLLNEFVNTDEHVFSITGKLTGTLIHETDHRMGTEDERFFEFTASFRIERIDYEVLFE
jgi:hypothetical protein